jgi:5-methylcytosine-specific restriction endonuclease McrA
MPGTLTADRVVLEGIKHGSSSGYNKGCRCDECVAYKTRKTETYYQANKEAICAQKREYRIKNADTIREKDRARYAENREGRAEYGRSYREKNRDAVKASKRAHYEANRDAILERSRLSNAANREARIAANKQWRKANPEKAAAVHQRRRARKKDAFVEEVCLLKLYESCDGICYLCDEPVDFTAPTKHPKSATLDHIVPLARGGTHDEGNCALACYRCNVRKKDKLPEEFWAT